MIRRPVHRSSYRRRAGLETVEYGIILGLIVAAAIGVLAILGNWVGSTFALLLSLVGG